LLNKLVGTLRGHVAASREVAVKVSRVDDQRESQANKELAMVQKIDVAVIGGSEKRVKTHRARGHEIHIELLLTVEPVCPDTTKLANIARLIR
jgi:hypothetical protein